MRQYSFNAAWLVFEKTIRILVTTLVAFYIARFLGPNDFGQLSFALAWVAILSSVCSLGLDSIALREISHHPVKTNTVLSTGILLKMLASIISLIAVFGAYLLLGMSIESGFILIASFALLFQPFNLCEVFFQAKAESKKIIQIQVFQSVGSSIIKLLIIYFNGSLQLLLWSYVFDALVLGIGVYLVCKKQDDICIAFNNFDWHLARSLLITAFPILLSGISVATYMKIDLIMLESMVPLDQVGVYSAAAKLSESWYFVPVAIVGAYSPLILKLKKESQESFDLKLRELYSLLIWGSLFIGIIVSIFSDSIINIVYGDRFLQADQVLIIHIWSGIFVCIGLVNSLSLLSNDQLYQNLIRTLLGALLNVGLNLLLIPGLGALGAAYATLIAYAFTAWVSMLFFKDGFKEFVLPIRSLTTMPKVFT
jgi:O-antigen/teichoic acid export membrane protein